MYLLHVAYNTTLPNTANRPVLEPTNEMHRAISMIQKFHDGHPCDSPMKFLAIFPLSRHPIDVNAVSQAYYAALVYRQTKIASSWIKITCSTNIDKIQVL